MLELGSSGLIIIVFSLSERILHLMKGSPLGTLHWTSSSEAQRAFMGSLSLGRITLRDKGYSPVDGTSAPVDGGGEDTGSPADGGGEGARGGEERESIESSSETDSIV